MEENREQEHLTVLQIEGDQDVEFSGHAFGAKRCSQDDIELIKVTREENDAGYRGNRKKEYLDKEEQLLSLIDEGYFEKVQEKVTAKSLMNDGKNPLLLAIKVAERLYSRAAKNEIHRAEFTGLANEVEEFILRFLDPLLNFHSSRQAFIDDPQTGVILETAVNLEQRKFFDHPVVIDLMRERWFGRLRHLASSRIWWLVLNIWCLFDIVLFPVIFLLAFVLEWISKRKGARFKCLSRSLHRANKTFTNYKNNFVIPYFVFVRDMLSYLALLGLHFAICVQPSQLTFISLEWAILFFLFGRLLIEIKQFTDMGWKRSKGGQIKLRAMRNYVRDRWNLFDLAILIFYFCAVLPLRIVTWAVSESVLDNRALDIAGYFYGFNTMLLTFRSFGSILEAFEGVGTVQIAFFDIIRDAIVVVLHFVAITVAFSSSITKIFAVKTSKVQESPEKYTWWKIASQLGLSLLELSDGLDFFKSVDSVTEMIVHLLYATYLIMALILLINLLIALLSNTYQRVQDNSKKEWEFRKAVTILTYCSYHPIPVPLNIISILVIAIYGLIRKKMHQKDDQGDAGGNSRLLDLFAGVLACQYRRTYGDSFPGISTDKLEQVADDSANTRRMVNQVLCSTFKRHRATGQAFLPTGPKAWDTHDSIIVEGDLLSCTEDDRFYGARYRTAFSPDFPHLEVMTLDSRPKRYVHIGVAFENYSKYSFLGKKGSVAYLTSLGSISDKGTVKSTTDFHKTGQGDLIRCTIMFEEKQQRDGKVQVPVVFTINGSRIIPEGDPPLMEYCPDTPLYPYVVFGDTTSVLAKMCERGDVDFHGLQERAALDTVKSDVSEVKSCLAELKSNLATGVKNELKMEQKAVQVMVESGLTEVKSSLAELKSHLANEVKTEIKMDQKASQVMVESELTEVKYALAELKSNLAAEVKSEVRLELADIKETLSTLLAKLKQENSN